MCTSMCTMWWLATRERERERERHLAMDTHIGCRYAERWWMCVCVCVVVDVCVCVCVSGDGYGVALVSRID